MIVVTILDILLYLPNHVKTKVPAYVMLNFRGNQSVTEDTDIHICESWMTPCSDGSVVNFHSTEKSRGIAKSRWPIEMIIDRGYALATACYQQLVPDYESDSPQKYILCFSKRTDCFSFERMGKHWCMGMGNVSDIGLFGD